MPDALQMQSQELRQENYDNCDSRCGGCGHIIVDRYYLLAVDRLWHCHCLKCDHCGQQLDSQLTCYSKAGLIYCKNDYPMLFWWQKCVRCSSPIQPQQLVMRINVNNDECHYYHVDCFTCSTCNEKLRKGDYFGRHHNNIYCKYHFQLLLDGNDDSDRVNERLDGDHFIQDCHYRAKLKERKKAKQKCDKSVRSSKTSPSLSSPSCSPESSSAILSPQSTSSVKRPKRNRTSFKHQQLRAMKAYFNLNHNPDSKDLKQLSLKTGLSKRVLQVWFQNQRAKWRRSLLRQQSLGPQIVNECQPLAELSDSHLINSINCDEELTIIEEEQSIATFANLC